MIYYARCHFMKHEQVLELVNNNPDLFDINIFQKIQDSTRLWSHLDTILFKGLKHSTSS